VAAEPAAPDSTIDRILGKAVAVGKIVDPMRSGTRPAASLDKRMPRIREHPSLNEFPELGPEVSEIVIVTVFVDAMTVDVC
jgi:hypothetical protein